MTDEPTKTIRVNRQFTLQVHQMDLRTFEANKTYEVPASVANHWWTKTHSEVLGEAPDPVVKEPISIEDGLKKPVPNSKFQKPLEMTPAPKMVAKKPVPSVKEEMTEE